LISFNSKFINLKSIINFLLDDAKDAKNWISKVLKSAGALKFI